MFVRTWLLHAPAAPVREKRTLQLWACLNLCWTGSVCLCVQVLHMLESNCTHAALYKHYSKLHVACSQIMIKTYFHYYSSLRVQTSQWVSFHLSCRVVRVVFAHTATLGRSLFFLRLNDTCGSWKPMCHVCSLQTLWKVFFQMIVIKQFCIVRLCVWLCNSHCDQWKAHNYTLTPEHRTLCEPLNPISQLAVLHPEQC